MCYASLHHIESDENAIKESRRVLKNKGKFMFSEPNAVNIIYAA